MTVIPIVIGALNTITKGLLPGQKDMEIRGQGGDHPNYCIIKIGQNTEKRPGNLRRIAVIRTPVKDHQLTLV